MTGDPSLLSNLHVSVMASITLLNVRTTHVTEDPHEIVYALFMQVTSRNMERFSRSAKSL